MNKALIVIPTYNEINNISELIEKIMSVSNALDILFIDDNSPDGTGVFLEQISNEKKEINLLSRPGKMGLGTAYIEGFKWAIENNYDYVLQMDADMSHNPSDIPRMLDLISENDLVIGSRYLEGFNVVNWPLRRLFLSYGANLYTRILTGLPISDSTGGFKCFRIDVLRNINLEQIVSEGYSFQIEMNYLSWVRNFKIKEISIVFTDRTVGQSKMSKKIILEAIFMVPKIMFQRIFSI
ncbi:MAG: dolichyl-phosphate beta-D-mannosyltransferase [Candidatus Marinimicrobia bacterium]|nr:dolichyl-phosphate beta-D-mannosyltransferase [Candidatus Neomarinimicrobiota bacterium]|tara:strand:+ start:2586 stop:3299 length:714 start_codon:yes stop_codon:yes gene_type:complete